MATTNKDFRVKNGLVVEGSTSTVNGNQVLTTASSLDSLSDVVITTPATSQVLSYNGTNWVNSSSAGGGTTTNALTIGTGLSGTSFNGSAAVTIANTGVLSVNGSAGAITGIATTAGNLSQFAATTSAQLAGVISDETGSGSVVFGAGPTMTLPVINNYKTGYTTTATAAGTTTLTSASNKLQFFTGSTTQTVVLPVTSTLATGMQYEIHNNSTGTVTVQSSGLNTVVAITAGVSYLITCVGTALTTAADWDADFMGSTSITGTGSVVLSASPTFTGTVGAAAITTTGAVSINTAGTGTINLGDGILSKTSGTGFQFNSGAVFTSTISASGLAGSLLTSTVGTALGTAAAGTATIPARADHVHPTTGLALLAGSTFTGQIQSTLANSATTGGGQIYLNGATGNRIDYSTAGVAAPAFTTRSAGTKIVLYPAIAAASVDYALGIENGTLWQSVPDNTNQFRWYAGTTNIATLSGAGALSTTSTISASGLAGSLLNTTTAGASLGTASTGSSAIPARSDHVHPTTGLGLTTSGLNQFAATTSAQLAGVISDETGSGALVFGTSPTLTTPTLSGNTTAGTINSTTIPSTKTLVVTSDKLSVHAATTSAELAGVISDETGSGSVVFGTGPTMTLPVINNYKTGYTTTVTAAGTTTLTSASNKIQFFTGTATQTVVLPVTSTLATGVQYEIHNNGTGTVTVQSSGLNTVVAVTVGHSYLITCIGTALTTAADWDADFMGATLITGFGSVVLNTSPTLVTPSIGAATATSLTTSGAINLNYASPAITSNNASAASIFTSTVTGVTIGSSTIKSTNYPAAPSGTTTGTVTQAAQLSGYIGMPQNLQATSGTFTYTFAASDAGKHIYATGTPTSVTFTIPANSAVAFEIGTTFVVMNDLGAATNISIAITTDTMQLAGTGTTGTRTLARYGVASITKVTATKWIISGNGLT